MTSHADSSTTAADSPSGGNGTRWRLNGDGQFVDSDAATPGWDLADEIVRLKIGETDQDQIRTPAKSKATATDSSSLETSSDTSIESSPHASEHPTNLSHSRGSSTDTTVSSSQDSVGSETGNTLLAAVQKPQITSSTEPKERPHSFSGGLSSADLRRLQHTNDASTEDVDRQQQQQWTSYADPNVSNEQLSYPSLANQSANFPRNQQNHYDYRSGPQPAANAPNRDELQIDYNIQQRNFNPLPQPTGPHPYAPGRPANLAGMPYRQRGFPQPGLLPSPTGMSYGAHATHMSLGNTQQLYDMMLPTHTAQESHHPAVTRVQQQHNVFRPPHHHHSSSDPSTLRDPATLTLLNNNMGNMQPFGPAMFQQPIPPSMQMYPNQYYPAQETYRPDVTPAQIMAARLQTQYPDHYTTGPGTDNESGLTSPGSTSSQSGPSANNRKLGLYKTELCRSWEEKNTCRYGAKCQFAHGEEELRKVSRHPKYKTEICRTFWVSGSCPYGKRCCFIHTELPASGLTNGGSSADGTPVTNRTDGRPRSSSTNSDPNDSSVSLLARISSKRDAGNTSAPSPMDLTSNFQFGRPPTGSLRVDTTSLDGPPLKQNKSAYPTFASNGVMLPVEAKPKSPAPVTAGPDLGRHKNFGYNPIPTRHAKTPSNPAVRHSFNASEDINFNPSQPAASSYGMSPTEAGTSPVPVARGNGHIRSGSAGNWGSFRASHLSASAYPGNGDSSSPWSTSELAVGSSRLHEKTRV